MEYLISMQGEDGGFKTVYGTTLAIQAYLSAKHEHPQFELAAARRWLVDAQSPNGAFGSMSVTSLAIGGLVDQSVNLAKDINCQNVLGKMHGEYGGRGKNSLIYLILGFFCSRPFFLNFRGALKDRNIRDEQFIVKMYT